MIRLDSKLHHDNYVGIFLTHDPAASKCVRCGDADRCESGEQWRQRANLQLWDALFTSHGAFCKEYQRPVRNPFHAGSITAMLK
jgi:hypothetical protein